MKKNGKLPSLSDSDMVTREASLPQKSIMPIKMSTVALALALTTAVTLTSCSDNSDCNSNYTKLGDPTRYNDYNVSDPLRYNDSNTTSIGDTKTCD